MITFFKHIRCYIHILFLGVCSLCFAQAEKTNIRVPDGRTIDKLQLDNHIQQAIDSIKIPGLSIAIVNQDKIVYHNTFGVTNIKTKEAVSKQTIFEAASLSKPVFAYFILKMVEKGEIALDKPIYPYLESIFPDGVIAPDSFEAYKTLTPRIILSHGTGIPNWVNNSPITIAFTPGTDFSYSGEAYQHLGAAFGTKKGIGWGSALDSLFIKEVAHPIGMDRSFFTWNDVLEQNVAYGHIDGGVNTEIQRHKRVGPGYSLHSDAEDYAKFLIEMMHPKNVSVTTRDLMLKEHNHFKPENKLIEETGQTGWGLGFAQKPTPYGLMHLHTGNNQDFQAYTMFIPEQEYGFVMFGNSNNLFSVLESIEQLLGDHF